MQGIQEPEVWQLAQDVVVSVHEKGAPGDMEQEGLVVHVKGSTQIPVVSQEVCPALPVVPARPVGGPSTDPQLGELVMTLADPGVWQSAQIPLEPQLAPLLVVMPGWAVFLEEHHELERHGLSQSLFCELQIVCPLASAQ